MNLTLRYAACVVLLFLVSGCVLVGADKGADEIFGQYEPQMFKSYTDTQIAHESYRRGGPEGHVREPYSRKLWNEYWNKRIFYLHGRADRLQRIRHILDLRRAYGLPELRIEPRNRDIVPRAQS